MNTYQELDRRIVEAIRARKSPLYESRVGNEARRLELLTGREDFRIIDGRLQALRKANVIAFKTKHKDNGKVGWYLVEEKEAL